MGFAWQIHIARYNNVLSDEILLVVEKIIVKTI